MADASLVWGGDLSVSAAGDIGLCNGPALTRQRVLRRLLTNPNDYIWEPTYGGGLGQFVGRAADARVIEGSIRTQMFNEVSVAHQPEPIVATDVFSDGSVVVGISYVDEPSNTSQTLTFTVGV
jgi:hypothetical protein